MATDIVQSNNDIYEDMAMHVGCVIKAKSGKIYKGFNIYTSHSICAEQVALGQAYACGEREFDTLVAVKMNSDGTSQVITPCGLCRYTFDKLGIDINIIVMDSNNGKVSKVKVSELLPYAYKRIKK